jgi:hypothetical protein
MRILAHARARDTVVGHPLPSPVQRIPESRIPVAIEPNATDEEVAAILLALQILRREARYEVDSAWKRAMRKSILCHPELVEGSTFKQLLECSENF